MLAPDVRRAQREAPDVCSGVTGPPASASAAGSRARLSSSAFTATMKLELDIDSGTISGPQLESERGLEHAGG